MCANYWFETLGVLALLIMTGFDFGSELLLWRGELRADPAAFVYNCIAIYFMYRWSGQKVARYKKEFDPKVFPGKRWQFFPPFC